MIIFWVVLTACGFLAGRASLQGRLERLELQTIQAHVALEEKAVTPDLEAAWTSRLSQASENATDIHNSFTDFIRTIESLGKIQVLTGRAVEVIDAGTFRFEELDASGQPVSQRTVKLQGVNIPSDDGPLARKALQLVKESLGGEGPNDPFVIVLAPVDQGDSESDVLTGYVATQSPRTDWKTSVLQFELIETGLARIDTSTAVPVARSREREAKQRGEGIWSAP